MKTKNELLAKLEQSREAFLASMDGLSEEDHLVSGIVENWTLKDILSHLTLWEAQAITLLFRADNKPTPNTVHFGKESTDEINERWYLQHMDRPLQRILDDFEGARNQTIHRVEAFSENDLFDLKAFKWLDGKPLWQWVAGETYEHEEEHRQHILAWRASKG